MKASEVPHKHPVIFVGRLEGEYGGSYPLYWCRECGTLLESFPNGKYAVTIPEMTRGTAEDSTSLEFVKDNSRSKKVSQTALGKGLIELRASSPKLSSSRGLNILFEGLNNGKKKEDS